MSALHPRVHVARSITALTSVLEQTGDDEHDAFDRVAHTQLDDGRVILVRLQVSIDDPAIAHQRFWEDMQ